MSDLSPILQLLSRALDVSVLRQSVYSANVANASVDGYQRLEVSFDQQLEKAAANMASAGAGAIDGAFASNHPTVVSTGMTVKLDEEMAAMARNALQYQTLVGAYERMTSLMRLAIREGRE
jgi:flagellar basal-body rod protein FlgB